MRRLKNFLSEWNEFVLLPILFVAVLVFPTFIRLFDATAGSFDLGIFQSVLVALFCGSTVLGFAWITFKISWPKLGEWFDNVLEKKLEQPAQNPEYHELHFRKAVLCFCVYFSYVAVYTIILITLI